MVPTVTSIPTATLIPTMTMIPTATLIPTVIPTCLPTSELSSSGS